MAKKELPFDKYKNRLFDYLHMQGISAEEGQLCSCPWHDDSTPSLSFFTDGEGFPRFKCFGCGREGDIYNAVEYCTGETNSKKQFEEIERIFGDGSYTPAQFTPPPKKERFKFKPNPDALEKLTAWLSALPNKEENILTYFKQRIEYRTSGEKSQYPLTEEQRHRLVTYFFWWPGAKAAEKALGRPLLFAAGIAYTKSKKGVQIVEEHDSVSEFPQVGKEGKIYLEAKTETCYLWNKEDYKYEKAQGEPREVAWWHTGILAKSPEGFKLLYMNEQTFESEKKNPRTGVSFFPIPTELPESKPVILMEGEVDAILCQTLGIENAFSMGGLGNLSVPKIEKYIIPKNIPEIILFADNDKAPKCQSQKAFGLMPYEEGDAVMETVPEKLIRAGFTGAIKVTSLPADCGFKDPDDAIRNERFDLVQSAIANAQPYAASENPAKKGKKSAKENKTEKSPMHSVWDSVPIKFFCKLIKKFEFEKIESSDVQPFLSAAYKACDDTETAKVLSDWCESGFSEKEIKKNAEESGLTPFFLIELMPKYGVSNYYRDRLEEYLVPATETLRLFAKKEAIIQIDYSKIARNEHLLSFLELQDNKSAADLLLNVADGKIIYVKRENTHYVFNGESWDELPGLESPAAIIFTNILNEYLTQNTKEKLAVQQVLKLIRSRRFLLDVVKLFDTTKGKNYFDDINFDSTNIRETLTLSDCVLDFSDTKIKFRHGTPEEFRRVRLPYTRKQIQSATTPENFLKFIKADFHEMDEDTKKRNPIKTAESLLYYLSLIPSRNTELKHGCFFLGDTGTGKSTLLGLLKDIFTKDSCAFLDEKVLVSQGRDFDNPNAPTPQLAQLEGKLVSLTSETSDKGKLNASIFKRLTAGDDDINARELNKGLHSFPMTAQVIVATNNAPQFYQHEKAVIRRLLVFRFSVEHEKVKDDKKKKKPTDIKNELRQEYPAIIRYLAEKYIELKHKHHFVIPLSEECQNEKESYIKKQSRPTDLFVEDCVKFTSHDSKSFVFCKELYACFLVYSGLELTPKEAPSQRQFIQSLKKDYVEFDGNYKQSRPYQGATPEWGFKLVSLNELGKEYLEKAQKLGLVNIRSQPPSHSTPNATLDFGAPPPEDDPFANASPPPPTTPESSDDGDESESNQYDIF